MKMLIIAGLGAVGVTGRYCLDTFFAQKLSTEFPISTFTINCVGSVLAGALFIIATQRDWLGADLKVALMVGLLGGFTTFSAFSVQTLNLLERKQIGMALLYGVGSPMVGIGCAFLGAWMTRLMIGMK